MAKDKNTRFTTKIVISAVIMTTLFTIACFALAVFNVMNGTDVSIPGELTALFFAFWTVEIVMLATLDRTKVKNKYHRQEEEEQNGETEE